MKRPPASVRPHCESVATVFARRGIDRIAKVAQPIDVPAHRPLRDLEAFGEFGTTPQSMGLKEREQL